MRGHNNFEGEGSLPETNKPAAAGAARRRREINSHFHIIPERGVVYVSVPKVASTTLKGMMARIAVGDPDYRPQKAHNVRHLPFKRPKDVGFRKFMQEVNGPTWKTFAFVRNPYSRLLSAYLDKFVRKSPEKRRETQAQFAEELGFEPGAPVSFAEFVAAVGTQRPPRMNQHWRPQTLLLQMPRVSYDFLGRMESFADDLDRLGTFLGIDLTAYYAVRDAKRTGAGGHLADHYTPDLKAAVDRIYAKDFELLGYPTELPG